MHRCLWIFMTIFYLALTCGREASATNLRDAIDTAPSKQSQYQARANQA